MRHLHRETVMPRSAVPSVHNVRAGDNLGNCIFSRLERFAHVEHSDSDTTYRYQMLETERQEATAAALRTCLLRAVKGVVVRVEQLESAVAALGVSSTLS